MRSRKRKMQIMRVNAKMMNAGTRRSKKQMNWWGLLTSKIRLICSKRMNSNNRRFIKK